MESKREREMRRKLKNQPTPGKKKERAGRGLAPVFGHTTRS